MWCSPFTQVLATRLPDSIHTIPFPCTSLPIHGPPLFPLRAGCRATTCYRPQQEQLRLGQYSRRAVCSYPEALVHVEAIYRACRPRQRPAWQAAGIHVSILGSRLDKIREDGSAGSIDSKRSIRVGRNRLRRTLARVEQVRRSEGADISHPKGPPHPTTYRETGGLYSPYICRL